MTYPFPPDVQKLLQQHLDSGVTVHGVAVNFAENQGVRHIFGGLVFSQEQRISAEE